MHFYLVREPSKTQHSFRMKPKLMLSIWYKCEETCPKSSNFDSLSMRIVLLLVGRFRLHLVNFDVNWKHQFGLHCERVRYIHARTCNMTDVTKSNHRCSRRWRYFLVFSSWNRWRSWTGRWPERNAGHRTGFRSAWWAFQWLDFQPLWSVSTCKYHHWYLFVWSLIGFLNSKSGHNGALFKVWLPTVTFQCL